MTHNKYGAIPPSQIVSFMKKKKKIHSDRIGTSISLDSNTKLISLLVFVSFLHNRLLSVSLPFSKVEVLDAILVFLGST